MNLHAEVQRQVLLLRAYFSFPFGTNWFVETGRICYRDSERLSAWDGWTEYHDYDTNIPTQHALIPSISMEWVGAVW